MNVNLVWSTPNGDELVAKIARVSNPKNEDNIETAPKLIKYLIRNKHWSPFEMVSACVEIHTTRDIARQILRHRSFSFQEFSQRYAEVLYDDVVLRDVRLQDFKNRQNSVRSDDEELDEWWKASQSEIWDRAVDMYIIAIQNGVAKEVARVLLPEGLTPTRLYMSGTLRSWIHYIQLRCGNGTQLEHQEAAMLIREILESVFPTVFQALEEIGT